LIDVQQHFADDRERFVFGVEDVIARLTRLTTSAREAGVQRVYVRAVETDATNTPVWVSRHITKPHRVGKYLDGSPGADYHALLRPDLSAGDIAITKRRYSAFLGTDLDAQLRARGISTLVIGGIATEVCVEVTAREAFQRDYWTFVVGDATTTRTPEEQARALADAEANWGQVVQTDEIVSAWHARARV
jgi:ureidoacrylate peracid hydrolase